MRMKKTAPALLINLFFIAASPLKVAFQEVCVTLEKFIENIFKNYSRNRFSLFFLFICPMQS